MTRVKQLLCVLLAATCATAARADEGPALRRSLVARPGGVHLVVVEAGDPAKPGILFLHGFAQSHLSFHREFESDLAKRYHLVAFDHRGQGASDKPNDPRLYADSRIWADDVAAVMQATGLRKPVLVGWSFGGYVAMDYIRHYGVGHIAGVDMVATTGGLIKPPPVDWHGRIALTLSDDLAQNIAAARATADGLTPPNATAQERDTLFATELMMPAYVRRPMAARSYDHSDMRAKVRTPVLFSTGSIDRIGSPAAMTALAASLPQARTSTYDGVGHLPFVERTERFNRELDAFASEVGAQ